MTRHVTIWYLPVLLIATSAPAQDNSTRRESPAIQVTQSDDGVLVTQGESKVLFYQRKPKSAEGQYTRANYVHPLYDLDGNVLTEDFPKDHKHHRGIFWAWHQLWVGDQKVGDPWVCKDAEWDVCGVSVEPDNGQSAALQLDVLWKSPLAKDENGELKPLVKETTTIRVHHAEADARKIDFEIRLLGLVPDVRIGGSENVKGYGGFCTRIRLPQNVQFIGETGELTPRVESVEGGAWLDMTGNLGGVDQVTGLAVLSHPTNPGHPQPWILRRRNSMQNAAWPGRHAVTVGMDKPVILRYRLIVHRGGTDSDKMQRWQEEYAGSLKP